MFRLLPRLYFLCLILMGSVGDLPAKPPSFSIKPAERWVKTIDGSENPGGATDNSSTRLLEDVQIRVSRSNVERYYHYVSRIDNASGLDDLSQLRFYFEPSYQQLAIHFVRIRRGNQTIESLKRSEVKLIQQEENLDQQLYNGTQAALIFLNDLRVGDLVDYAFTITGENPVLNGQFADTFYIGDSGSIEAFNLRLIWPTSRALEIKTENTDLHPIKQVVGEETEYVWQQTSVYPTKTDGSTPSWFSPYPRITLSEFKHWSDVVNWALPYYEVARISDRALQAMVDKWRETLPTPQEQAIAALRFVQDEVRYLGIELGRYSHEPTRPEKVFARRFGDCKDKSLLLATIYAALGIEAAPALVNSFARSALDSWQPSPFAFDHVIVKANINGKTYWFDPTVSYQRGILDRYYSPMFERALVLRKGSSKLEQIGVDAASRGSVDVVEVYKGGAGAAVTLTVVTTYRGAEADSMRYRLSVSSLADLGKAYLNFYADSSPSITADGLPSVEDDQNANILIVKEKYSIAELWKDDKHHFLAEKISVELEKPGISQRTMPLGVSYPLSIRHSIVIDVGSGYDLPLNSEVLADEALRFEYRSSKNGNQLSVDYTLQTFRDSVPVEKVQQHLAIIDRAQRLVGFELPRPIMVIAATGNGGGRSGFGGLAVVRGFAILLVVAVGGFLVWIFRNDLPFVSRSVTGKTNLAGTSLETAIRVSSDEERERVLRGYSCRCGNRPYQGLAQHQQQRLTYDGNQLLAIHLKCERCRQESDLYLKLSDESEIEGALPMNRDAVPEITATRMD